MHVRRWIRLRRRVYERRWEPVYGRKFLRRRLRAALCLLHGRLFLRCGVRLADRECVRRGVLRNIGWRGDVHEWGVRGRLRRAFRQLLPRRLIDDEWSVVHTRKLLHRRERPAGCLHAQRGRVLPRWLLERRRDAGAAHGNADVVVPRVNCARACAQCPLGYFCTSMSAVPTQCGAGNFCPSGSAAPSACSQGYYGASAVPTYSTFSVSGVASCVRFWVRSVLALRCEGYRSLLRALRWRIREPRSNVGPRARLLWRKHSSCGAHAQCFGVCTMTTGKYCPAASSSATGVVVRASSPCASSRWFTPRAPAAVPSGLLLRFHVHEDGVQVGDCTLAPSPLCGVTLFVQHGGQLVPRGVSVVRGDVMQRWLLRKLRWGGDVHVWQLWWRLQRGCGQLLCGWVDLEHRRHVPCRLLLRRGVRGGCSVHYCGVLLLGRRVVPNRVRGVSVGVHASPATCSAPPPPACSAALGSTALPWTRSHTQLQVARARAVCCRRGSGRHIRGPRALTRHARAPRGSLERRKLLPCCLHRAHRQRVPRRILLLGRRRVSSGVLVRRWILLRAR